MKEKSKKFMRVIVSLAMVCSVIGVTNENLVAQEKNTGENGLELNKTATKNSDGTSTISLEAYTTGTVTTIQKSKPTDIVLVLDQSGSMEEALEYDEVYKPVYAGGGQESDEKIDGSKTYYIKGEKAGEYKPITMTRESVETGPGFAPVYVWKTSDGFSYYPLTKDNIPIGVKYESVQFYNLIKKPKGDSKLDVLKSAATTFVENVVKDEGNHRVAVVGFGNGKTGKDDQYLNTNLFIGSTAYTYGNPELNNSKYASAFQSADTESDVILQSINALTASGATRPDLGLEMANNVFVNAPKVDDKERSKIVVMFTDGEPTNTNAFEEDVANSTISNALKLKQAGTTVFSVGVVDSLNHSLDPEDPTTNNLNRYMHFVSSNYPNATSLTNPGKGNYKDGKFLAASNSASLKEIFKKISEEISSTTSTLDNKTILKDIMSDYFTTPDVLDIKTYTSACTGIVDGKFTWGKKVEDNSLSVNVDKKTGTIDVTGFSYKEKFVAVNDVTGKPRGSKLVVEFKTTKIPGFIGGSQVPTNNENSGIYVGDQLFEKFPQPTVNYDIEFKLPTNNDMGIYVGSNNIGYENIFDADINQAGIQYFIGNKMYTLDGKTNAYVDIVYTVTIDGNVIGEYTILAGSKTGAWGNLTTNIEDLTSNTNIKLTANITASKDINNSMTDTDDATIYVFTPEITVKDQVIFLGEDVDLDKLVTGVKWVNTDANAVKPIGAKPTLNYQYTDNGIIVIKDKYAPTTSKELHVQVWNGLKNITAHSKVDPIHIQVVNGQLSITKKINQGYTPVQEINANQTFVFRIDIRDTKNGPIRETFYQTIDFSANEKINSKSVTIRNLSKGYYTISEESSWSWKYDENVALRSDNYKGNGTVKGVNENQSIFIGDRSNTDGKMFYGSASGTIIDSKDQSFPATTEITNIIKNTNILGDGAIAKNQFT
ncbi:MAG: VWA domain-containing protein, partial [Coprobacillus sp.]